MSIKNKMLETLENHLHELTGELSETGINIIRCIISSHDDIISIPIEEYDAVVISINDPKKDHRIYGYVFFDMLNSGNHPFKDGEGIVTSKVISIACPTDELKLVKTNNTKYLVI